MLIGKVYNNYIIVTKVLNTKPAIFLLTLHFKSDKIQIIEKFTEQ